MNDDQSANLASDPAGMPTMPMTPVTPVTGDQADPQLDPQIDLQPNSQADPNQTNPLDVLEKLLTDAKTKSGGRAQQSAAAGQSDLAMDQLTALADDDVAAQKQQLELERQQHEQAQLAEDQDLLQKQQQMMAQIKESPQYQARVQQDQAKVDQASHEAADQDGLQIRQLGHTKIH